MSTTRARTYPFNAGEGLDLDPLYAQLRAEEPLSRVQLPHGEPAWLATRYEDARTVLGDPRFSRAAVVHHDEPRTRPKQRNDGLLAMDPPDHTRLRRLVAKAFTARRVERLRPRTQEIADGLVSRMRAAGPPADLVEDFALPLPITVICELLGVPFADRDDFRTWSDAFVSTTLLTAAQVEDHMERMFDYIAGLIQQRRAEPADDLISGLVEARDQQDRLTEREMVVLASGILVAGHETTASQIPNFVHVLLDNPEQCAALRADPALIPAAVEELMRFVPLGAGAGQARYAAEDVQLGGVTVRAGEAVLVSTGSANRDEQAFPEPERFDVHREGPSHLGFGHGPHHCLGAQLARMELQVALATLLDQLPGMRVGGPVEWKSGLAVRSPRRMPLTWQAA
ncbi:cytochrome P450 [Saccharopolyspora sp. HNM0983]|uniref:Cytochrome P450 n=1 Tax=Saccharopolyspora montiporae TaxID=2781240 RepID=A0A929B967_9PSEU|nr:cytochrome P450 [Saccharopolyspora sp. HNM0983]MBE9374520.1 cytochrome P450 [Saccharopolyspora sp. HNM0983]